MSMASFDAPNNGSSENKQSETEPDKPLSQCIICSTRQRAVVFVPCGHLVACVPCGHGLTSCPTCGSNIKALVRVFS